jgi:ligand-binding SRPBCC domain-containing protein
MPTLVIETKIHAPIELCFDLARSVDAHQLTAASTRERVVAGKLTGLLELGDRVTFEAVHLGIRQRLTAQIVELERPHRFVDEMVSGVFSCLRHVHEFHELFEERPTVLMRDTLEWRSPLGPLGVLADKLFVARHLHKFLLEKQRALAEYAEAQASRQGGLLAQP